ncbi:MAG: cation transporter [Actinobacteria bacterium HGW-Actinobacteria-6]|jgi:cation diffusion facilitator family transporter|nr:MAG: cation transporter [Methanomicrobiales archaeon HGW-Methanomicrobiales-5]PKQ19326.1 MAG: cation transporter [Actinobacteria bacterium HGW-Actinobacteria-6]
MSSGESKTAVIAAITGNFVIAIIKFIAATITGSSAMIAEGIHSLVDTGNGALLLLGIKQSKRPADDQHPFGYGKSLYFWSLIVAMSIFGIGGGMSLYEGISHLQHPSPLTNPTWNYVVLAIAFVVEGASFTVAIRQFNKARGTIGMWEFIRESKDPGLYTVVFEDGAAMLGLVVALLGVFLGHLFENPLFDGLASMAIGVILVGVAWLLAVETKGLLLGEGADATTVARLRVIVDSDESVDRAGEILTMYMGTHDMIVTVGVQFKHGIHAETIHRAIHRIENAITAEFPQVRNVYIEVESLPRDEASA